MAHVSESLSSPHKAAFLYSYVSGDNGTYRYFKAVFDYLNKIFRGCIEHNRDIGKFGLNENIKMRDPKLLIF